MPTEQAVEPTFPPDDATPPPYDTAMIYGNPAWGYLTRHAAALAGKRRIGIWYWELPVLPMRWAAESAMVDEVWAPSRYIADMIRASTKLPIHLVPPPAVVVPVERDAARAVLGLPLTRRIILAAFDFSSFWARKNPEAAIRALKDAFPPDCAEAPLLLVKCHRGGNPEDAARVAFLRETPNTVVIDRTTSTEEMRLIHAAADAFVSLHRSEGFGLNILDMMALGRICIATGFSGNVDFMTPDNSILIPWTMRAVGVDEYPDGAGQWWAEPDHDAAVSALRWVGTASDSALSALGERARSDTLRDFSLERIAELSLAAWEGQKPVEGGTVS